MSYNFDFAYAAIVICIVMIVHENISKQRYAEVLMRFVNVMIVVSIVVSLVDIIDSLFFEQASYISLPLLYITNMVLYLFETALPYILLVYIMTLSGYLARSAAKNLSWQTSIFFLVTTVLVLTTPFTGWVFSFDAVTHAHSYGPVRPLVFLNAFFYGVAVAVFLARNKPFMRKCDVISFRLSIISLVVVVILQALFSHVCLAGFGSACVVLISYLSVNNPNELYDASTGLFEPAEFRRKVSMLMRRGTKFNVVFINVSSDHYLSSTFSPGQIATLRQKMGQMIRNSFETIQVYKFRGARFGVITYTEEQTRKGVEKVESWFNPLSDTPELPVSIDGNIGVLLNAEEISKNVDANAFLDFLINEVDVSREEVTTKAELVSKFLAYQEATKALERGIANDSFEIFLQPLLDVKSGQFSSVEVLSRLKDENGNYVSPAYFIDIAEKTGSIRTLSYLQFNRLCRFLTENMDELNALGLRDVKYNISPAEVVSADRGRKALGIIKDFGLDPKLFSFELTESAAADAGSIFVEVMETMRSEGCRMYMDDFGSGYANLDTIFRLPFDGVKLDISLLKLVLTDEKVADFYHGLIDIMHSLDKTVVSEGVEQEEETQLLAKWGVDIMQGYYYSKPLSLEQYLEFMRANGKSE